MRHPHLNACLNQLDVRALLSLAAPQCTMAPKKPNDGEVTAQTSGVNAPVLHRLQKDLEFLRKHKVYKAAFTDEPLDLENGAQLGSYKASDF